MSNNEAKQIVAAGLERRREAREMAAQEAQLEQYEQDMIDTCNVHCADAKVQRQKEETGRLSREQLAARKAERQKAYEAELAREQAATDALTKYVIVCLAAFCLTIFTHLPVWAATTLALGLGVFPAVYIFRLYFPLDNRG